MTTEHRMPVTTTPSGAETVPRAPWSGWVLPVCVPCALVLLILGADLIEGPKTAFVGVLAVIPMLAAVFGSPVQTGLTGVFALLSAYLFGHIASDGNATAQWVRLAIIATSTVVAVFAARLRERREAQLTEAELSRALAERLHIDANTDVLTGLFNRRGLIGALATLDRSAGPYTVAIADCDNFKQVNDAFGHTVGDSYLQVTARRLERSLASQDLLARWGGDEFLIVLPLPVTRAATVLERVARQAIGQLPDSTDSSRSVSMTFGAAEWHPDEDFDSVVLRADHAMYRGKGSASRVNTDLS